MLILNVRSEKDKVIDNAIVERAIAIVKEIKKKRRKELIKQVVKNIKSDNFTRSNREESSITIAILK